MSKNPARSTRRLAIELGLNDRTVRRLLYNDLGLHIYKIAIVKRLNVEVYALRAAFAENMLVIFADNDNEIIMMSL